MSENTGHGHVFPRPDKVVVRCGGPALCEECRADLARRDAPELPDSPAIIVPPSFTGTDAEAVALAVAGAVGGIVREREAAVSMLGELLAAFPDTSWAHDEALKQRAAELLADLRRDPDGQG